LKQSPLGAAYAHFSNVAGQKTVLDTKTKELIRLAVASVFRLHIVRNITLKMPWPQERQSGNYRGYSSIIASGRGTQLNWHKEFLIKTCRI